MTQWFLDFDDTLIVGPVSLTLDTVIPKLLKDNHLPLDQAKLDAAAVQGLEDAAHGKTEMQLLNGLFEAMDWPKPLMEQLLHDAFDHYRPVLYPDSLPFLQAVSPVYIISNNNRAPQFAELLGIMPYIKDIFTPIGSGVERGKPARDLWDVVCASCDIENAVMVGDDPWSDGAFATICGIEYYMVDRANRFASQTQFRRVRSLLDILDSHARESQP
ncbi:MAG TPA: HAD family hydrolase [Phototrophicaceae bacterium]|nr:HAD family hydrolase [Phototrophicaceae bacterium]